jgi:hypothetical protein
MRFASIRAAALASAIAGLGVLPTGAAADRAWQEREALPAGVSIDSPAPQDSVLVDASGNGILGIATGPHSYALRPHGGPLGARQDFPAPLGNAPPRYRQDAAGDVFAFTTSGVAFKAAGSSTFGTPQTIPGLTDLAVAPTGEAMSIAASGGQVKVSFRPAGAASTFDLAGATTFLPSGGHDSVEAVGVALDANGGAVAVYRSYQSGGAGSALLQSVRPAGGAFGAPTEITLNGNPWRPAAFDAAADGTAVLVGGNPDANTGAAGAVRAPGGAFPAPATIADAASDPNQITFGNAVAVAGGGGLAGYLHKGDSYGCAQSFRDQSARVLKWTGSGWALFAEGPAADPLISSSPQVRSEGATVGVQWIESANTDGDRCTFESDGRTTRVKLGTLGGLTADLALPNVVGSQAFQVGASGDALVSWGFVGDSVRYVQAFEDRAAPAPGGGAPPGGGTPPGGSPPGGGTPPGGDPPVSTPTAPPGLVLSGPIASPGKTVTLTLSCKGSPLNCGYSLHVFGPRSVTATAAAAKPIGSAKGSIAAGKTKRVTFKLTKPAQKALKRSRKLKVRLEITFKTGTKTTKVKRSATLKLR